MPLAPGQVLHNRYRIVKLLGQGGFGAVYRAWDLTFSRAVAVKENLDLTPESQRQFNFEARLLANLNHPHLPRVTDTFFLPGQGQYLVMDFIEGQDLQSLLDASPAAGLGLDEAQVLPWIAQICEALAYLHAQNPPVIHRDIKPANIKINLEGQAVLVDFGIAKTYAEGHATSAGAQAVTPGYSPPEQYGRGSTDARSDLYALGATLYHLLTGQRPVESVQRVVQALLIPPRQLNPAISSWTEGIILQAMETAPQDRIQTAVEFKLALESQGRPSRAALISPFGDGAPQNPPSRSIQDSLPAVRPAAPGVQPAGAVKRVGSVVKLLGAGAAVLAILALAGSALFGGNRDSSGRENPPTEEALTRLTEETGRPTPQRTLPASATVGSVPTVSGLENSFTATTAALITLEAARVQTQAAIPPTLPPTETPAPTPVIAPVIIEPYCGMYEGGSPVYVQKHQPVTLWWRWDALTAEQVQDHIQTASYEIYLDGVWVEPQRRSEIEYLPDKKWYRVSWFAEVGALSPGTHTAGRYLSWSRRISDGWNTFGPGGQTETEWHECEIIVR